MNPFATFLSAPRFRLGWILIFISLINAIFWTAFRWKWENQFLNTQVALDYEDTRSLSDAYGVTQTQLLKDFKAKGANSLVVYDQTLGSLRDNGRLAISPREVAERQFPKLDWAKVPVSYRYFVTSSDEELIEEIYPRLLEQSPKGTPTLKMDVQAAGLPEQTALLVPASKQLFNDAQLGFDPQQIQMARDNGYMTVARISNSLNLTPTRLTGLLDDVQKQAKAKIVMFPDDEVLGYDTLVSSVAREMRQRGLLFTNTEFSKQRGLDDFSKNTDGLIVRVHTVQGDEAARLEPEMFVERFVRAAKERNMRMIYVRIPRQLKGEPQEVDAAHAKAPLKLEKNPYDQNLELVGEICDELQRNPLPGGLLRPGLVIGETQGFTDYPLSVFEPKVGAHGAKLIRYLMLFLSGLGVVGSTILLLNLFFDWSEKARKRWLWAGLIMVAGLSASAGMGAKLMALQAGWTLPIVALLWGGLPLVWDGLLRPSEDKTAGQITLFGFKILWRTTLLTLIGGVLVVAFLNNWRYMSKADEFLGEKATQFLPLLIVPLAFLGELFPHRVSAEGATRGRKLAMARINRAIEQPFTARIALISLLVLGVGYLWMARFGNDSGMQISSFELKTRALMERVFITRPRSKEIFFGHPAFFVAIAFMLRRQKFWAFAALIPAVIGQADVLNTMCHIHTPVFFNLWRSIFGVFIGTAAGFVALLVLDNIFKRPALARSIGMSPALDGLARGEKRVTVTR